MKRGVRTSQKGDRDVSRKKDVLAAITFLATGFLFFVAQIDGAGEALLSQDGDCVVSETMLVEHASSSEVTSKVHDRWSWDT